MFVVCGGTIWIQEGGLRMNVTDGKHAFYFIVVFLVLFFLNNPIINNSRWERRTGLLCYRQTGIHRLRTQPHIYIHKCFCCVGVWASTSSCWESSSTCFLAPSFLLTWGCQIMTLIIEVLWMSFFSLITPGQNKNGLMPIPEYPQMWVSCTPVYALSFLNLLVVLLPEVFHTLMSFTQKTPAGRKGYLSGKKSFVFINCTQAISIGYLQHLKVFYQSINGIFMQLGEFSANAPFWYCPNKYQLSSPRSWRVALLAAAIRTEVFSSVGIAYACVPHWGYFHLPRGERKMWLFHNSHAESTQSTTNKTRPGVIWKQEVQMHRHETLLNEPALQAGAIPFSNTANHGKQHLSPRSSGSGTRVQPGASRDCLKASFKTQWGRNKHSKREW